MSEQQDQARAHSVADGLRRIADRIEQDGVTSLTPVLAFAIGGLLAADDQPCTNHPGGCEGYVHHNGRRSDSG